MPGFTPINFDVVWDAVGRLKSAQRMAGFAVLCELLSRSRRTAGMIDEVPLERGDAVASVRGLAEKFSWPHQRMRTTISALQKCSILLPKSTQPFLVVSICNYDAYISDGIETNTQSTHDQHTTNTVPNGNGKRKSKEYDTDNPFHEEVTEIFDWFYKQESKVLLRPTGSDADIHLNALRLILDRDMSGDAEHRGSRLRTILEAALADEFWNKQVDSLSELRSKKGRGQPMKWQRLEAKLVTPTQSAGIRMAKEAIINRGGNG